jgi:hypothetical protein
MRVSVAYADPRDQVWLKMELPEGATVRDAIERSGVLSKFPHIDLETQKVGIFGKVTSLTTTLNDGDRVELYRAIIADPKTVPRRDQGDDEE